MNYTYSLSHDDLVVETKWLGEMSREIIIAGVENRKDWILENCEKAPLILLSDYTNAILDKLTSSDLEAIADRFRGIQDLFPGVNWISIMPTDLKYGIARTWQAYAELIFFSDTHVVKNRAEAEEIISNVLESSSRG